MEVMGVIEVSIKEGIDFMCHLSREYIHKAIVKSYEMNWYLPLMCSSRIISILFLALENIT